METDTAYYRRLAQQELEIGQIEADPATEILHLNLAAQYATLADRQAHKLLDKLQS